MPRILVLWLVLFLASPAAAERLCVNPEDAECFATIQAAVDAAVEEDEIQIAAGLYNENVVVDTADLAISGRRGVWVDPDDPLMGPAFTFNAPNFELDGVRIRNGQTYGIVVAATATGGTIDGVWISGPNMSCIHNEANDLTIEGGEFQGCGIYALDHTGDGLVFEKNFIKHTGNSGILGVGNDGWIERNDFYLIGGDGIDWEGDRLGVEKNRFKVVDQDWVDIDGNGAEVIRNRAETIEGSVITGTEPSFESNRASYLDDHGFDWFCEAPCVPGGNVENNRVSYTSGDDAGFRSRGGVNRATFDRNRAEVTHDEGFHTGEQTFDLTFTRNRVKYAGGDQREACFDLDGMNHTLRRNRAQYCHGEGYDFFGDGMDSAGDDARDTDLSGFFVATGLFGVSVNGGRQRDANGAGYEISMDAVNTFILRSRSSGENGQEACDEGINTVFDGSRLEVDAMCRDL